MSFYFSFFYFFYCLFILVYTLLYPIFSLHNYHKSSTWSHRPWWNNTLIYLLLFLLTHYFISFFFFLVLFIPLETISFPIFPCTSFNFLYLFINFFYHIFPLIQLSLLFPLTNFHLFSLIFSSSDTISSPISPHLFISISLHLFTSISPHQFSSISPHQSNTTSPSPIPLTPKISPHNFPSQTGPRGADQLRSRPHQPHHQ